MEPTVPAAPARSAPSDFRVFLAWELARRCERNPQYSLRAFAQQLEIDHSTLSQLLRGKRTMTGRTIEQLGRRLSLPPEHVASFQAVERQRGETIETMRQEIARVTGDAMSLLEDGTTLSILELVRLEGFRPDSRWIGKVLGLTPDEVNLALFRLLRLELLELRGERWVDRAGDASRSADAFSRAIFRQLALSIARLASTGDPADPPRLPETTPEKKEG